MDEPTHLYRAFDVTGRLLYVGIARNWPSRWTSHARTAAFFAEVSRLDVETHPTRDAALDAERAAIKRERPAHNVVHNRPDPLRAAEFVDEAWESPVVAGTKPWTYASRMNPAHVRRTPLWLQYELDYSPCIIDADDDEDPLEYYRAYLRSVRRPDMGRHLEISWSVRGGSTMEVAPFDAVLDEYPDFPNFLRSYTWPVDDEGAPVHWYSLPVRCRFPGLEASLGWKPSPMQREVDFESLLRSLETRPDRRTVTARWER